MLPSAMKADNKKELSTIMPAAKAPINSPGQYFLPPMISEANAKPLEGQIKLTLPLYKEKLASESLASRA